MLPRPSAMLPRPSRIPVLTTHNITKTQHNKSKPTTQKVKQSFKASRIPIFNYRKQKPAKKPQVQHSPCFQIACPR